jgi:hypothetical protein
MVAAICSGPSGQLIPVTVVHGGQWTQQAECGFASTATSVLTCTGRCGIYNWLLRTWGACLHALASPLLS